MDYEKKYILEEQFSINNKVAYNFISRILDICLSLAGIVLLFPFFILIAFCIKIDDPYGTILFAQNRVGKNGKVFKMYKFRSMHVDAEKKLAEILLYNEIQGAMFKMKNDPRITRVGKYLRKFSLDELPQLLNVLIGNMSLIGPRPPLLREVKEYSTYDKQRLIVRPGITGLWQVSGRNSLSFNEMVELDLQYIKNQSLSNDFKIIIKTIKVVVLAKEAY